MRCASWLKALRFGPYRTQEIAMTTSEVNAELFRAIADVIEEDPNRYNQQNWGHEPAGLLKFGFNSNWDDAIKDVETCGTSFCIAGHAAALSGYVPLIKQNAVNVDPVMHLTPDETALHAAGEQAYILRPDWYRVKPKNQPDAGWARTPAVARDLLGLTPEDADILFDESWEPETADFWDSDEVRARKVAEALRDIAAGDSVRSVTNMRFDEDEEQDE